MWCFLSQNGHFQLKQLWNKHKQSSLYHYVHCKKKNIWLEPYFKCFIEIQMFYRNLNVLLYVLFSDYIKKLNCLFVRDVLTKSIIPLFQNYFNKSENLYHHNTRHAFTMCFYTAKLSLPVLLAFQFPIKNRACCVRETIYSKKPQQKLFLQLCCLINFE